MTKLKLFIFICFCALSTITQAQYTLQLSDVDFSDGEITDYTNTTEKNIIIPDNFNDVAVTSIGKNAFYGNQLTEVIIPNSVKSIGSYAFRDNDLTEVSIGNSVLTIGDGAFRDNRLTHVIIPNSVNSIGEYAFYGNQLTHVSISNYVISIGKNAFRNNELTHVSIPNSVTSIGESAFRNNELTHVSIPNSVTSIGESAFSDNTDLTFNLPTHYQGYSYSWSNSKKSGDEITNFTLGYVLDEDTKGNAVDFTITYTLDGGTNDANNPADYTVETATITLAEASKDGYTFEGWYSDAAFTADNEVTEIATGFTGDVILYAKFDAITYDISYTLDGGTNAANNPADYTVETATITLANASKTGRTFKGWYSEAAFTNQVTEIATGSTGDISLYAKYSDEYTLQLSDVTFSNGEITDYSNTTEKNIIIPDNFNDVAVTSIGENAFQNNQLTQVSIPNSVNSIGKNAFSDNTGLTSFNLPTHYQGYSYPWSNGKKSGDEITDFALSYELDEDSKGDAVDFTISYTLNGGTNSNKNPANYIIETETIILADASKVGYTFKGWYSDAAFTADNEVTEIATGSTGSKEFFAKFSDAITYDISYTLDGGTNAANNPADYTVETATITLADASKVGYTFEGWYSEAAFTNQVTEIATGSTGPKEFFAKFSDAITYDISYTLDGGTNAANNPADYTVETATITLAEASKDGYTFDGWYSEAAFTNQVKKIATGSTGDISLYAKYSDEYTLTINDVIFSNGEITDYTNATEKNIIIPDNFNDVAVETIGKNAFRKNELTQIIIPNSVKSIGEYAFYGNPLTHVSIPNFVTSIGKNAFRKNELTHVSIPNYVTSMGEGAFYGNQLTEVSIPNSVTSIGKNAFSENTGLTSFNLPAHYQGSSYPWSNGKKSGDEITDFALSYVLDEGSKGDAVDFTISYTLDGGTNDANNPAGYTVETATIILADASKDGYTTFAGWYSDAAFTNQVTEIATGSTGDVILYAKFDAIAYDITYTLDGGTNDANNPADYTVETATITLAEASKDGYTFEGWYSDAAFTNQVTEIATGSTGPKEFFAKFSDAITYDISYTLDGGTNAANNPADYTVETATITLENASKDHYTFEGWYSDAAFTNQVTEIATGSTGPKEFFAKFSDAITYNISYTLDGGTNDANNPADYTVETATITLEDASKDHYTFEGWYSDAAFTNQVTEIATGSTGHKEFFAKFSDAITYDITYILDGGTNAANNPADYTVETATITLAEASKDGYTFEGWYSDAAFTADNEVTEIATGSTEPKEFFAKFSDAITYDITYTLDGGTNAANNPADYTVETATITLAEASKDGYTFEGWYSDAAFTNQVTEIATGSTGHKEFFAKFSEIYIISYTLDGGTNAANNPADYTVETATITLADASKDGYTFEGWYSDAAFTADNEVTEIATGSTGDVVLYAKFDEITYDISYTLDGGTNAANNPADYTVETATITLAEASKDGYTFEGWYSEAAFTNQVTEIATGSTGDVVLFAKYSEIALGIYTTNIKVLNFYPNPSINFIQTELEVSSLTIRSISGSKVKQFEGGSFFDISNLKSGVYILLAIDKNGDTYKSKLLKE